MNDLHSTKVMVNQDAPMFQEDGLKTGELCERAAGWFAPPASIQILEVRDMVWKGQTHRAGKFLMQGQYFWVMMRHLETTIPATSPQRMRPHLVLV